MSDNHNISYDRRSIRRISPDEDVWVVTSLTPVRMGALLDISPAGISYKCLENGIEKDGEFFLDLFFSKKNAYHEKFRVRMVSNKELATSIPFKFSSICRAGVAFVELSEHQQQFIDGLMAAYE